MKPKLFLIVSFLAITSLACSFSVNMPKTAAGPEKTLEIKEAIPDGKDSSNLTISMGAGNLFISPGSDQWVTGTIHYNIPLWNPEVKKTSLGIHILQETKKQTSFSDKKIVNDWDIKLGNHPTNLEINAGAYQGDLNLSGIPLTKLRVNDGASQASLKFSSLNPVEMSLFHYSTGASQIDIIGLANMNANQIIFDAGPGSYTLDFSGDLQKDTDVEINFGLGDVKIIIPKGMPAFVYVTGGLNNVRLKGTWNVTGNEYTLEGKGPQLFINVKVGLGNLELVNQ